MAFNTASVNGIVSNSSPSSIPVQWYEGMSGQESNHLRSVTPAMNNTRSYSLPILTAASTTSKYHQPHSSHQCSVDIQEKPNKFGQNKITSQPPSSTGLIRLALRKPMGIVFEPMYDPHNPGLQRGVRICDLPRTGAAALSRNLEVGDELLSINNKTMSRLTFDEVMDFIIEANPEHVNLLFRRPRKETLLSRQLKATNSNNNTASVKWIDDDHRSKEKRTKVPNRGHCDKKQIKARPKTEEDDTFLSTESGALLHQRKKESPKPRKVPYESESFLDLLIDSICANTDSVCRDRSGADRRRDEDDYYSDDDHTLTSADDSTYVTYESERFSADKGKRDDEDQNLSSSLYDDTSQEDKKTLTNCRNENFTKTPRNMHPKDSRNEDFQVSLVKAYEDDATLETVETAERAKEVALALHSAACPPPLGLVPHEEKACKGRDPCNTVDAPISELEYDGLIDHGADVSVMESLGGPSLLIEKPHNPMPASKVAEPNTDTDVSKDLVDRFGLDYPAQFGLSKEQTIQNEPFKFYTFVVKKLLNEHEPEKVRLLDKLLAKYKGREEHLVRKLSVRYDRYEENDATAISEGGEGGFTSFVMDVNRNRESKTAAAFVQSAKARLGALQSENSNWPSPRSHEDDTKQVRTEVRKQNGNGSRASDSISESDFSGDSIDGTSPAVIAQVSELLNYVYGKTSVPGQIDRVSTIMRAYEGREAILLELLETKALIKANTEENAINLPSFLRNSPALQHALEDNADGDTAVDVTSPVSGLTNFASPNEQPSGGGTIIQDDLSSMSGVSAPANGHLSQLSKPLSENATASSSKNELSNSVMNSKDVTNLQSTNSIIKTNSREKFIREDMKTSERDKKMKKKGLFGVLFGKKGKKDKDQIASSTTNEISRGPIKNLISSKGKKGSVSLEGSI